MATRRSHRRSSATASNAVSAKKLPAWARVTRPQRSSDEPLSLCEEEAYVRTMTYHETARTIDLAAQETLVDLGLSTLQCIERMALSHLKSRPSEEANSKTKKKADHLPEQGADGNDNDVFAAWSRCFQQHQQVDNTADFDPLLLPVLLLQAPLHSLDRHEWSRHLVQACKSRLPRTSVVWLRPPPLSSSSASSSNNNNNNNNMTALSSALMEEVTRQCLWQEHERQQQQQPLESSLPPAIAPSDLRRCSHSTELLQLWASRTRDFDSVLVIVDNQSITTSFLSWAAQQRELFGIPFTIVLMYCRATDMDQQLAWHLQSHSQYLVQRLALPSSALVLQQVWRQLYVDHNLAFHLPHDHVASMMAAYGDTHGSFVVALQNMKMSLAQFFSSHRGSGLLVYSLLNDGSRSNSNYPRSTTLDMVKRRQWFLLDPKAKRYIDPSYSPPPLSAMKQKKRGNKRKRHQVEADDARANDHMEPQAWLEQLEQHRRQVAIVMQLEASYLQSRSSREKSQQTAKPLLNTLPLLADMDSHNETISKELKRELIELLFRISLEEKELALSGDVDDTEDMTLVARPSGRPLRLAMLHFIHKLVVVLDQVAFASDLLYTFEFVYQDWFACLDHGFVRRSSPRLHQQPPAWSIQTRRETIRGLIESAEDDGESCGTFHIAGALYRLLDSFCSVSLEEWFALFQARQGEPDDRSESRQRSLLQFASGVYALQVQGLMKGERKTSSGKSIFDKSVLVWCGCEG